MDTPDDLLAMMFCLALGFGSLCYVWWVLESGSGGRRG